MSTSPSNRNLNVTVVGAGIVGAAIAYSLAKRGVAVTVVDKGRPGGGAHQPFLRLDQRHRQAPGRLPQLQPAVFGPVGPVRPGP